MSSEFEDLTILEKSWNICFVLNFTFLSQIFPSEYFFKNCRVHSTVEIYKYPNYEHIYSVLLSSKVFEH
jgi:hypothetical protein